MEKYIIYIILGIILIILGIINFNGNISSVHRYNRSKVAEADIPKYGKFIGIGTGICGVAIILTAIFELFSLNLTANFILPIGLAVGLIFILYSQFKYNKGLF